MKCERTDFEFIVRIKEPWYEGYKKRFSGYPYWGLKINGDTLFFPKRENIQKLMTDFLLHEYIIDKILGRKIESKKWEKIFEDALKDFKDIIKDENRILDDFLDYKELMSKKENLNKIFTRKRYMKEINMEVKENEERK